MVGPEATHGQSGFPEIRTVLGPALDLSLPFDSDEIGYERPSARLRIGMVSREERFTE